MRISDWSSDVCSSDLPVGADEIGVAELTDRLGAILLAPRPQIAAGEAAEDRAAARLRALALQGEENLFDRVDRRFRRSVSGRRPRRRRSPSTAGGRCPTPSNAALQASGRRTNSTSPGSEERRGGKKGVITV